MNWRSIMQSLSHNSQNPQKEPPKGTSEVFEDSEDRLKELTPEERDFFEERAAIAEYDGGLSREAAEAQAYAALETWISQLTKSREGS